MLRGYWSIGLAAILATAPLNAQQSDKSNSNQTSSNHRQSVANDAPNHIVSAIDRLIDELAKTRDDKPDPDENEKNQREKRDLIAQEESAKWAKFNFYAVIIQTIVASAALYFLMIDLRQNRKSSEAQLRAYLAVEPGGINKSENGKIRIPYNLINYGQSPAYEIAVFNDVLIMEGDPGNFNPSIDGRIGDAFDCSDATIGPNTNVWHYKYENEAPIIPFSKSIELKRAAIVHYGYVEYRDVFQKIRRTNFAFYHWGEELTDVGSKRCRFGNHST